MKNIAILGSTGSIGVNCLQVVDRLTDEFRVTALSTHQQVELLMKQTRTYRPKAVGVSGMPLTKEQVDEFAALGVKVFQGDKALEDLSREIEYDLLVNAVVGAVGFLPTLTAVENGRPVALANKEALVIGGSLVTAAAEKAGVPILPIDSEHSAIFQCLLGENRASVEEIIITGSGGPFRTWPQDNFRLITVKDALQHPNWVMGKKITVDSATLMNKGLEVIEAHWLFGLPHDRIRVIIHPQSIIHSMVVFHDGSVKAQLGVPDMRIPIQLAMTFPDRRPSQFPRLNFLDAGTLTFEKPDLAKFPALNLAYQALRSGGTAPAVLNAANEVAVFLFLAERLRFVDIPSLIDEALSSYPHRSQPDAAELLAADRWARSFVVEKNQGR